MSPLNLRSEIDRGWTLFLDRDGVINVESVGSYVTDWSEFNFHEGVLDSLRTLSQAFGHVIVVSNQRGVGRGIMTLDALKEIHGNMSEAVEQSGGRINKVYACTATIDEDRNRKPNIGMGLQAQEDFPLIDFKRSVMVGNSLSDMEFGKRLSMHTVFLTTKHDAVEMPNDLVDEQYPSLEAWAKTLMPAEIMAGC